MDIPSIINHNYYVLKSTRTNRAWICEAERFDDKDSKLYYYYGTYELGSDEHKNNCYLSNSYYDILPSENDEVRLATMEEIDILMDILEKNGIVITLQEAKDKAKAPDLKGEDYSNKRFGYKIPDGYEFDKVENGKIILKPIKPKYPTTYVECKEMLDENVYCGFSALMTLRNLIICRDAYWKIAGEEMGLDKPWEPDWNDLNRKYFISLTCDGIGLYDDFRNPQVLVFPTEEMRDVFYENFKDLIEQCKELL